MMAVPVSVWSVHPSPPMPMAVVSRPRRFPNHGVELSILSSISLTVSLEVKRSPAVGKEGGVVGKRGADDRLTCSRQGF